MSDRTLADGALPVTRGEAKAAGSPHYFTGMPCKFGHIDRRQTLDGACRQCAVAKAARWRSDNRETARDVSRRSAEKRRREKPQAIREAKRRDYRKRAESVKAAAARWQAANPEKVREYHRNRKARVRGAEGSHTAAEVAALFKAQRGRCAACRIGLTNGHHADHIVAVTKGGSNWIRNIQLLCEPCNLSKYNHDMIDWMQSQGRLL